MRYIGERLPLFDYYLLIILSLTLLAKAAPIDEQPPSCHKQHDETSLVNQETVDKIHEELQSLYGGLKKDAKYEEDCTHLITSEEGKEFIVTELLELFELRFSNYQTGLWGYCGKEGAENLLKDIAAVKKKATEQKDNGTQITMCDRDELLDCHKKYNKCQCLEDYRNFRDIETEWWNNTKESEEDPEKDIFENQCVFSIGSDCPVNSIFHCIPGSNCLFKDTHKPCVGGRNLVDAMHKSRSKRDLSNGTYFMTRNDYPSLYCECFAFKPTLYNP